jgi:hypothetical protein
MQAVSECNPSLTDATWHHIVGILDKVGAVSRLHVDGKLVATTSKAFTYDKKGKKTNSKPTVPLALKSLENDGDLFIGRRRSNADTILNGSIDDVRIYDRALSEAEVKALYASEKKIAALESAATSNATEIARPETQVYNGASWDLSTVDSTGNVGRFTSLAFSPEGQPAISYHDDTNGGLKVAVYNGTSWDLSIVDTADGRYTSLAFSPGGQPAISYENYQINADLKYAVYNGASWDLSTVDSDGDVGWYTSLAFSPIGQPAISYWDRTNRDLEFAVYNGASWVVSTVDSTGDGGEDTSLAFGPGGQPAISYYDVTNEDLKYAVYNGASWDLSTIDSAGYVGRNTSLAFSPIGQPAISYFYESNGNLKVAIKRHVD